ncbi:NapC/NirT family cytochrome c [Bacillus shivajii]|uniref:cytochrome c3 family protein n=1 Tax=Bacillus shivajii TaxID=1983719 RepID=UPI001CFB680F|nr:NapC/NirT family cytochrome c [Bacillus shivajii]UCZ52504.1 NapC/NirT family cytochrome c [Bacillus shivajii]
MKRLANVLKKKSLLFILGGIFLGIVFSVGTAETMKATDSAEFCSTCHLMDTAYESFMESNHATLSCNDCHAPRDNIVSKMTFKAQAGFSHMYMNTIGANDVPDVIHAKAKSQEVINENCIDCHEAGLTNVEFHDVKNGNCIDCHRQVPHGGGKYKPDDWFEPMNVEARS